MSKSKAKKLDKHWKVLKEAKKYLLHEVNKSHKESSIFWHQYICWCVDDTSASTAIKEEVKDYILSMLDGWHSFETWVGTKVGHSEVSFDSESNNQRKLQHTRHAWLNWMIADCKSRNI